MHIPRNRVFWSVSLGHMANDIFMAAGPVLLAFIGGVYMDIPAAYLGIAISAQQMLGAVSQPVAGWLSDKGSSRVLGAGGVFFTISLIAFSMLLAMLTQNFWLMIIPFALGALGSGAFHPVGTSYASYRANEHAASSTAMFFWFGQMGLAIGPALMGFLLGLTQVDGEGGSVFPVFIVALAALPSVLFMLTSIPRGDDADKAAEAQADADAKREAGPVQVRPLLLLALLVALRGFAYPGMVAFIPVLFRNKGWDPAAYGSITSVYWIASATAGVFIGYLADRFGRRVIVTGSLLLAVPVLFFLPSSNGALAYLLVLLSGALVGGSHSILVVLAQNLLPGRKGFASGVALGYIFGAGAVGTLLIGYLADGITLGSWTFAGVGLVQVFQWVSLFVLLSGLVGLLLPSNRKPVIVKESAPEPQPGGAD